MTAASWLGLTLLALAASAVSAVEPGDAPSPKQAQGQGQGQTRDRDVFVDRAAETGLDFVHFNGMTGDLNFAEMMGQGAALVDYDGDGDLDAYMVQGNYLDDGKKEPVIFPPKYPLPLTDRLYRNDSYLGPDGKLVVRFTDVTDRSGDLGTGYGMGVTAGDYDNDGWMDLYITNLGSNQLLHNRGDGTFEDVTAKTGTDDNRWSVPAVFFDYDRDGWLDLYVGNYVDFRTATNKPCSTPEGARDYCGPSAFNPEPDRLFHNRGDGTFEDVTVSSKLATELGSALGATAADFDGDGWVDLYVGNDGMANQLWLNQHDGTFENGALLGGCAVNAMGQPEASMGVVTGDLDGNGTEDLFMTHLERETNTVYLNDGHGIFEDRSQQTGLGTPSWRFTGFGTALVDYDGDGLPDLFVANGAVTLLWDEVRAGDTYALHQTNSLYHNLGGGHFKEVTDQAGEFFKLSEVSRGVAMGDVDEDGDSDLLMANSAGPARLLFDQIAQDQPWLGLRLVGAPGGRGGVRDMLGARAILTREGAPPLYREARTCGSYASSNDPRVLFGLGKGADVESVRLDWPDGTSEEWYGLEVGRYTTLYEGTGTPAS